MLKTGTADDLGLSAERLDRIGPWMRGYVDDGRLPCAMTLVARHGEIAWFDFCGSADVERGLDLREDTIFRIYSMTKPVTAVAVMMLYEEGRFQMDTPLASFLPEFADMEVHVSGEGARLKTEPASGPITIAQLLTHTSGLTYGFLDEGPVGAIYRDRQLDFHPHRRSLVETVEDLATVPLAHQPGARWNYGVSFDVLGRLVEAVSGLPFDRFCEERIFSPLGMTDTSFAVPDEKLDRFAALYQADGKGGFSLIENAERTGYGSRVKLQSGGGGLMSTMSDYFRFTECLRRGGMLGSARLLGRKTVAYMTSNQIGGDMAAMGQPRFGESSFEGIGFGFGVSVMLDPARAGIMGTPGEYAWGGAASTAFWIDPQEDMTVIFMTQLMPSSAYPLRRELRVLTYQALVD